jgi:uncharacterized membrane protein
MDHAVPPTAAVRRTRALALTATIALILLGLAWELWLAPTGRGTLAVKVLPLLLPIPGMWHLRLYTYRWTSLGVWAYVAEGATRAGSEHGVSAGLALLEVALALIVFAACCVHIRARLRAGAARAVEARAAS